MIYLLDTDIFVFLLRGRLLQSPKSERQRYQANAARKIQARCQSAQQDDDMVGLSAITIAELEYGARKSENYEGSWEALQLVLSPFATFDFDAVECTVHYGNVRYQLETAGIPIGALDTLIAAHALALGATLVTNNTSEFVRIPELKVENWTA